MTNRCFIVGSHCFYYTHERVLRILKPKRVTKVQILNVIYMMKYLKNGIINSIIILFIEHDIAQYQNLLFIEQTRATMFGLRKLV